MFEAERISKGTCFETDVVLLKSKRKQIVFGLKRSSDFQIFVVFENFFERNILDFE